VQKIMAAPKYPKSKPPSKGYVINDPKHGSVFIGSEPDGTVNRKRQIAMHSASNASVKLFEDGGFEIASQPGSLTDNINSESPKGLAIKGRNIYLDAGNGTVTINARSIVLESTGSDQSIRIGSNGNIDIEAGDTLKLKGSVTAVVANTRMFLLSKGSLYGRGASVNIVEKKTKLIPTSLNDIIQLAIDQFLGPGF